MLSAPGSEFGTDVERRIYHGNRWSHEIRDFFTLVEAADEDIDRVIEIVHDRGGLDYAKEQADLYGGRAWEALAALPQDPAVDALRDAVTYTIGRDR